MNTPQRTVIEVNGVKLEVDLRHARRIEEVRVGSRVKVLQKTYGESYEVKHGVVIGFEPFTKLPTIIIACLKLDYNEAKIEWVYYNAKSEDVEIVLSVDDDMASLDKESVIQRIDREIGKKQSEIAELENRKSYFLRNFAAYWQPLEAATKDATSE